jgi:hypothetical protein
MDALPRRIEQLLLGYFRSGRELQFKFRVTYGAKRALQLFPGEAAKLARRKDHARADAMLLAYYGLKVWA